LQYRAGIAAIVAGVVVVASVAVGDVDAVPEELLL
jgi:hypothetical protein